MCFGCSKEPSDRDCSFENPQHIFRLRNKKNNYQLRTLILGPDWLLTLREMRLKLYSQSIVVSL